MSVLRCGDRSGTVLSIPLIASSGCYVNNGWPLSSFSFCELMVGQGELRAGRVLILLEACQKGVVMESGVSDLHARNGGSGAGGSMGCFVLVVSSGDVLVIVGDYKLYCLSIIIEKFSGGVRIDS